MDVWFYIPGIRQNLGSLDAWTDQFTHLTHFTTPAHAYPAKQYFWVIRNYKKLKHFSNHLAALMQEYLERGYRIHIVAHSNGGVVACRLLRRLPLGARIETLHAIAPAAWGDCVRNGLVDALHSGRLGRFYFYGSTADSWVKWGRYTGWVLRPIGAGYGGMGFTGPRNIPDELKHRVHPFWASKVNPAWLEEWRRPYSSRPALNHKHSTWFDEEHYRQTFARIQHYTMQHLPDYATTPQTHGTGPAPVPQDEINRPFSVED